MNTLYTERLILRPFKENDYKAMFRNWTYDERVAKYCKWYPHKNIEETREYLKRCISEKYCWAITIKGDDDPFGEIDLVRVNEFNVPEIGYDLMYEHWGKGFMTEAVKAVINELFMEGFVKIGACHRVDNPASGKVMEKCGMTYVRNSFGQKKFGSDEQCEIKCYEIVNLGSKGKEIYK